MKHTLPSETKKPYDIRERLFLFACEVVSVGQKLHTRGPIAGALAIQLVNAAVSAAANAEEADDASSGRDFRAKARICLREVKEARLRLRVLHAGHVLDPAYEPLIQESLELRRILSTMIRNNEQNDGRG